MLKVQHISTSSAPGAWHLVWDPETRELSSAEPHKSAAQKTYFRELMYGGERRDVMMLGEDLSFAFSISPVHSICSVPQLRRKLLVYQSVL